MEDLLQLLIMIERIWFIDIKGNKEGPFSILELRSDPRFTPDTYVWKEGFPEWLQARYVPELKQIFEDSEDLGQNPIVRKAEFKKLPSNEVVELDLKNNNPFTLYWLIAAVILITYFFYEIYWSN